MRGLINSVTVIFTALLMMPVFQTLSAQQLTAKEIVTKADEKFNGEMSGYSVMSMTIVRPTWQRTVEFKSWSMEKDYALTLITAPAREKGQTFLKRGTEMWSWNPAIKQAHQAAPLDDVHRAGWGQIIYKR